MSVQLLTAYEKTRLSDRQPLPDRYLGLSDDELHRRIALAGPPARFEQGSHPLLYWPGLLVFVGLALGFAALIARALQAGVMSGAAFVGGFLGLFLWQGGNFFRRNRPGLYRPEALPAELMPKG